MSASSQGHGRASETSVLLSLLGLSHNSILSSLPACSCPRLLQPPQGLNKLQPHTNTPVFLVLSQEISSNRQQNIIEIGI